MFEAIYKGCGFFKKFDIKKNIKKNLKYAHDSTQSKHILFTTRRIDIIDDHFHLSSY